MEKRFLCNKTLFMDSESGGEKSFTEGKIYSSECTSEDMDSLRGVDFIDDKGDLHSVSIGKDGWLQYFTEIE